MLRSAVPALVVTASILSVVPSAAADIYNPQSILATEAEEGLTGAITGSADWRTGNVSYLFLTAGPVARYRSGDHLLIGIVTAERRSSRGTLLASRVFEHLRYRYGFSDTFMGELFLQHEFDAVRRLQLRALVGVGPRAQLVSSDCAGLGAGSAYMLEYERIKNDAGPDAGATDLQHRVSTYVTGHYQLDDRIQMVQTVYVQPRVSDLDDTRLLSDTRLVVEANQKLSLSTSFAVGYDRAPPALIERVDTALVTSLSYQL